MAPYMAAKMFNLGRQSSIA